MILGTGPSNCQPTLRDPLLSAGSEVMDLQLYGANGGWGVGGAAAPELKILYDPNGDLQASRNTQHVFQVKAPELKGQKGVWTVGSRLPLFVKALGNPLHKCCSPGDAIPLRISQKGFCTRQE